MLHEIDFQQIKDLWFPVGARVITAILCGGAIGIEREYKRKPAGLKTNMLISVGACLYTIVGTFIHSNMGEGAVGDPARISAQVVSGIGFLGAGTIIQARGGIQGLTSAATIWVVAAIGVCSGAGYPIIAIIFTVTVLFTLLIMDSFEKNLIPKKFGLEILLEKSDRNIKGEVNAILDEFDVRPLRVELRVKTKDGKPRLLVDFTSSRHTQKKICGDIWKTEGVAQVRSREAFTGK